MTGCQQTSSATPRASRVPHWALIDSSGEVEDTGTLSTPPPAPTHCVCAHPAPRPSRCGSPVRARPRAGARGELHDAGSSSTPPPAGTLWGRFNRRTQHEPAAVEWAHRGAHLHRRRHQLRYASRSRRSANAAQRSASHPRGRDARRTTRRWTGAPTSRSAPPGSFRPRRVGGGWPHVSRRPAAFSRIPMPDRTRDTRK